VLADEPATERSLADAIQRRFRTFGGVDLQLPPRQAHADAT